MPGVPRVLRIRTPHYWLLATGYSLLPLSELVHPLLRLAASVLALAILPPRELHRFEAVEAHMGTLVRITVYAPAESAANEAFRAAFDRIRDLDCDPLRLQA